MGREKNIRIKCNEFFEGGQVLMRMAVTWNRGIAPDHNAAALKSHVFERVSAHVKNVPVAEGVALMKLSGHPVLP